LIIIRAARISRRPEFFILNKVINDNMRPKIVLVTMIAAIGVLGLMVVFKGILSSPVANPVDSPKTTESNPVQTGTISNRTLNKKGRVPGNSAQPDEATAPVVSNSAPANALAGTPTNTGPVAPITSVVATTPAEDRQVTINKDLNRIRDALLAGASNPEAINTVRDRLQSQEPEVRKAATVAAMHLNDRGAIPILKVTLEQVKDTREKVTILDAIEYLQIPDSNDQVAKSIGQTPNTIDSTNNAGVLDLPRN
jgi:hypothetical protein